MAKSVKLKNNIYLSQDSISVQIYKGDMDNPVSYTLPQTSNKYKYIDFIFTRGTDYGQGKCRIYYDNNYRTNVGHCNLFYTDSNSNLYIVSIKVEITTATKDVTFISKTFDIFGHTVSTSNNSFRLLGIYGYK